MPTGSRKRRNFDMGRMREAMRGPGADTRVWVASARVDDDEDAREWDPELGWLVDVTFYGGPLDQEGPVPCRLGTSFAERGGTQADPPALGCDVLVAITDGDANSNPVIIARMHNSDDCSPPALVNLFVIDQDLADANHITVTPHGELRQLGGDRRVDAPNQELVAGALAAIRGAQISLGGVAATPASPAVEPIQPAVLGTLLQTAQSQLTVALNAYAAALLLVPIAGAVSVASATTAATALTAALTAYSAAVTAALSAKVKLD